MNQGIASKESFQRKNQQKDVFHDPQRVYNCGFISIYVRGSQTKSY